MEDTRDVIVMVAPNGGRRRKSDHPAIPITIAEAARDIALSHEAGAAMAHIHVRDDDGGHSLDPGLYAEAISAIEREAGPDLVIQITTEAIGKYDREEQIAVVKAVRPEAVSIALPEVHPVGTDDREFAEFCAWMRAADVWPQFILYGPDDLVRFQDMMARGLVPFARPFVLFVLGRYSKQQEADPEDLNPFLEALERDELIWSFCAFGTRVFTCAEAVMAKGGHIRIGLENNYNLPDGSLASSNAELVRAALKCARAANRTPLDAAGIRSLRAQSMA